MEKKSLAWASGSLLVAVALGAFGAHGLKAQLSVEQLANWRTGVEYQFYHSLGLLLVASMAGQLPAATATRVRWCFVLGTVFFSGSLYLLSTRELTFGDAAAQFLGPITPLGGLFFMIGWALLLITALRGNSRA